jgi:hypothetical protein
MPTCTPATRCSQLRRFQTFLYLLLALLLTGAAQPGLAATDPLPATGKAPPAGVDGHDLTALVAFARLQAWVRWFHPSDEAAAVDWDRYLVHGAGRLKGVSNPDEIAEVLRELLAPIAPSVRIRSAADAPTPDRALPATGSDEEIDLEALPVVAWQYLGFGGDANPQSAYSRARSNRPTGPSSEIQPFGTASQALTAMDYRGQEVRLRCSLRADVSGFGNQAQAWLRVDRPDRQRGFFDNMSDRPVRTDTWQDVEIRGRVADDATMIAFGVFLAGRGTAWADDLVLEVLQDDGTWRSLPVRNGDFELADRDGRPAGWICASPGYRYAVVADSRRGGSGVLEIRRDAESEAAQAASLLFEPLLDPGEEAVVDLGAGLIAHVPLTVHAISSKHTHPVVDHAAAIRLQAALDALPAPADLSDPAVRMAEVAALWGVLRHFYPYQDVVQIDWDGELIAALSRALNADTESLQHRNLELLIAALHDGHGSVTSPGQLSAGRALPDFRVRWIGNQLVVTESDAEAIQPGDLLLSVDGVDAPERAQQLESKISGSPQWKREQGPGRLLMGPLDSEIRLVVARAGEHLEVAVRRERTGRHPQGRLEPLAELEPGVWYVDLRRVDWDELVQHLGTLAAAAGVVFDVRGYPTDSGFQILPYLMPHDEEDGRWMQIPRLARPGFEPVSWSELSWNLTPAEPRLAGRIVFLTDGRAISYAESVLGYVEGYRLATIVGSPTAGANGNVASVKLPGGHVARWTGMRVIKHDGSVFHNLGVTPDLFVEPTPEGLRAGRDDVLEAGLMVIRQGG